jgi:hypothetical protein
MGLVTIIPDLGTPLLGGPNAWYRWQVPGDLPTGISICGTSAYHQNVSLKKSLHEAWAKGDATRRFELTKWYISRWGGIHRNSRDTIEHYAESQANTLINRGQWGIASWSKALCIHDPDKYAIFDARVSMALNSLIVLNGLTATEDLFPILSTRNKEIGRANAELKKLSRRNGLRFRHNDAFYLEYLKLLKTVVSRSETSHPIGVYTIEMLLFSLAPTLTRQAFP